MFSLNCKLLKMCKLFLYLFAGISSEKIAIFEHFSHISFTISIILTFVFSSVHGCSVCCIVWAVSTFCSLKSRFFLEWVYFNFQASIFTIIIIIIIYDEFHGYVLSCIMFGDMTSYCFLFHHIQMAFSRIVMDIEFLFLRCMFCKTFLIAKTQLENWTLLS